jgi:hypothetical protein
MNGMESINSAIREKVNVDAQAIIKDAEERAGQRVASAKGSG